MGIIERVSRRLAPEVRKSIAITLCLVAAVNAGAQTPDKPKKLSREKLTELINAGSPDVYYGGVMIATGDTLSGPIAVIAGSLDIQDGGVLVGDAWIVDGKLILTGRSLVDGDVNLVNSEEFLSHDATIKGALAYHICECGIDDDKYEKNGELSFLERPDPKAVKTKRSIQPGAPNRTDYNIVNVGVERNNPLQEKPYVSGYALIRFPLWLDTRGYLGFDAELSVPLRGKSADLFLRAFKRSYTNDGEQSSSFDAILNLTIFGLDFADYYERRGGAVGLRLRPYETVDVETGVMLERDISLETREAPSLFDSDLKRRPNPPIDDGDRVALWVRAVLDQREDVYWPKDAWYTSAFVEKGIADGPGEFSYTAFEVEARRYHRLPIGFQFDMRGQIFSTFDEIPLQVTRSLQGYDGIRGIESDFDNFIRGDRVALLSVELSAGLPPPPLIGKVLDRWRIQIFTDMGLVETAENVRAPLEFLDAPWDQWEKFGGVGIVGETFFPFVGLYISQDLGSEKIDLQYRFQMERMF